MSLIPLDLEAVTLFSADLLASRTFYEAALGAPVVYEDDDCFVMDLDGTLVNVLDIAKARELIQPAVPALPSAGVGVALSLRVRSTDAACDRLRAAGVSLLNGPIDRPWGRRTAAFADPSGHVWEVAEVLGDGDRA